MFYKNFEEWQPISAKFSKRWSNLKKEDKWILTKYENILNRYMLDEIVFTGTYSSLLCVLLQGFQLNIWLSY